ncbi:molybdopterin-synthase adenylyltransferase MoeB [Hymenobacter sp. BT175]|uniref:molybdopterin-synthase adenylyltransferase MoeB n=1 Tax=Hymenobacter translucens TaxID=2886507 RepID=UPI001D0E776A|nr:molybdopterin-synthase adenylyltransferase MoeB [Hymenobacter translucens]MCC2547356.1 molybdopterin-synthase adenylyltransferase MoeB [Hymenobacter translucens]
MTPAELHRYSRHLLLPEIGLAGQQQLKAGRVLVVGCGGLGCPVLQYLAAAGVGTLGLLDFDTVDETNLQRQILYGTADVGRPKAVAAAEKLRAQNPYIDVQPLQMRLSATNALELFEAYDVVVDCSDNFATRYLVNDACVLLGKPLVFGAIFKFEGQVSVFNYRQGPTYRCLFPTPPAPGEAPGCSEIGVMGVLPGIVGTLQASEAIKLLTGAGEVLSGRLLLFDALLMRFQTLRFKVNPAHQQLPGLIDYPAFCGETPTSDAVPEMDAAELKRRRQAPEPLLLLDVREPHEHAARHIGGRLIPLAKLPDALETLDPTIPIVVHCASGRRSQQAARLLLDHGFRQVWFLRNGLQDF